MVIQMSADNYDACYDFTMQQEGGYSSDPNDKGNWTGCAVGVGELKGTNKGISACAYPDLDIASLTDTEIEDIYRQDYWNKVCGDDLPKGVDLCTWDSGVNCGPGMGVTWLQRATGNPHDDGAMGPETLEYVAHANIDGTIDSICDQRMAYYKSLSDWDRYGAGWSSRVDAMRTLAHQMADTYKPPMQVITITITAPPGVQVQVNAG